MSRRAAPSSRTNVLNRRAAGDSLLLLDHLERFANLPDNLQAFDAFFREYPGFVPVELHHVTLGTEVQSRPAGWRPEFYDLFRVFRDKLRDVWERGSNSDLAVLLGTDAQAFKVINRTGEPEMVDRILSGGETPLQKAIAGIPPNRFTATPSKVHPDWRLGTFRYEADTDFRRAVYELFRQSWRAKICPQCDKHFIADKPPQRYCSTKCYGSAKRSRDLEFWRNVGSNRRKERKTKERRS